MMNLIASIVSSIAGAGAIAIVYRFLEKRADSSWLARYNITEEEAKEFLEGGHDKED